MWENKRNNVNKMLKEKLKEIIISNSFQCFMTYPQIDHKQENKIRLTRSLKKAMHIFTPLIIIIFYI